MGHVISVPNKVLDQRCLVAVTQSIAPQPSSLEVRGIYRQDAAVPLSRRKAHPGVQRGIARMRAAVHPDSSRLFVVVYVLLDGNELLRLRVSLFPNPDVQRAAVDVGHDVRFALMLRHGETGSVIAQSRKTSSFIDRKPEVVRQLRTRDRKS